MNGRRITKKEIAKIKQLRETGHSLPEICKFLKRGGSTIHKYAKDIAILPEYQNILKQKQGGSINRSKRLWSLASRNAGKLLKQIGYRDKLFILAAIYWGEGNKKDLSFINSDPDLVRVFILCLKEIGVEKRDLRVSIRIYDDIDIARAKKYWAEICRINVKNILSVNILKGSKVGKLPYGMCRVRVAKGGESFKLIMSMIDFIKTKITSPRSSVD